MRLRRRSGDPPRLSRDGKLELTETLRSSTESKEFQKASTWLSPQGSLREVRKHPAFLAASLQLLPHLFPVLRHLGFSRCVPFGRLWNHDGLEPAAKKRLDKRL
jgi:hypothetical protein